MTKKKKKIKSRCRTRKKKALGVIREARFGDPWWGVLLQGPAVAFTGQSIPAPYLCPGDGGNQNPVNFDLLPVTGLLLVPETSLPNGPRAGTCSPHRKKAISVTPRLPRPWVSLPLQLVFSSTSNNKPDPCSDVWEASRFMISLAPEALERVAERRGAKPSRDPSPEVGCMEQWVTAPT